MKPTFSCLLLASFIFPLIGLGQSPTRIAGDATGNYSVIAFMVDFQDETGLDGKDTDQLTYGTGKFVTTARDSGFLDSWPRDRSYFENHLTYLKNYWARVSEGKLNISQTHVVSSVITLPRKMRSYSSIGQTQPEGYSSLISDFYAELEKKPAIIQEIKDHYAGKGKTHFIIFHAGLGRDIDWGSILGGDPTPADLPSLFINEQSDVPFSGREFPSGFVIDHLSILPETLSRTVESFGKNVLLSFGINGVMIANFGNFLGLPDLYNTKTGASGVGSFGLMDGYGFFNFNGFIPSPPNVWEKYQLGWINPVVTDLSVLPSDWTVNPGSPLFIHLGDRKYYLLETLARNPEPSEKGVTVTTSDGGNLNSTTFLTDKDKFYSYSQTGIKGVITDVSNPYWVIPAGINSRQDTINGGLLIWRLDDGQLSPSMTTRNFSQLNSSSDSKVLKVMEADGSFDIGQTYDLFSGGGGSETGTIFDYWYQGNIAPLFKGEFSMTSTPSSEWAYRIPSGLKLTGFTRAGNGIKVNLSTDLKVNPLVKSRDVLKIKKAVLKGISVNSFLKDEIVWTFAKSLDSLRVYKDKTQVFASEAFSQGYDGISFINTGDSIQTVHQINQNQFELISVKNGFVLSRKFTVEPLSGQSASDWKPLTSSTPVQNCLVFIVKSVNTNRDFILEFPSGLLTELSGSNLTYPGAPTREYTIFRWNGNWYVLNSDSNGFTLNTQSKQVHIDIENSSVMADSINGIVFVLQPDKKLISISILSLLNDIKPIQSSAGELSGNLGILISDTGGFIRLAPGANGIESRDVTGFSGGNQISSFPLSFQDPVQDIRVIETETELVTLIKTNRSWFSKTLYSNDEPSVFPTGLGSGTFTSLDNMTASTNLLADSLSVERVVLNAKTVYPGFYSNNGRENKLVGHTNLSQKQYSRVFNPNNEVIYSWPNPSSDGLVKFRLNLPFTGDGKITLLDLSGQKIGTINVSFSKNQETEWVWDTGNAQSGLYFASVELSGEGKAATKVLKVVLIK